jgi:hypothetical protein
MNIKRSQLSEIIQSVVREVIKERNDELYKQRMQEVAPPGWGPDKKHSKLYNKIKAQYPDNDKAAYATMWKIHKKISEALREAGLTSEASYKVAAPTQTRVQKDNHAREVQGCPKVTENHKVQHRSACTVKDLPNNPKNLRDPEVPNC